MDVAALDAALARSSRADVEPAAWLESTVRALVGSGLDRLPGPGSGRTLERWSALAAVAAVDLGLVKLYESHTDALAILAEIGSDHRIDRDDVFAVWASEGGVAPIRIRETAVAGTSAGDVVVDGRKSWCSGAAIVDVGLMTATDAQQRRWLVAIRLDSPGVTIDRSRWNAVGMHDSGSFDVCCDGVRARRIGAAGAYLDRPGFWQGGVGVAACWYGAAAAIGSMVRDLQVGRDDVHALAHLGAIDTALVATRAVLREAAVAVDREPRRSIERLALQVRGLAADLAGTVIHHAGRAMGPGPLCNDARLARLVADLPIFVRQSRAEHDRVAQARALIADAQEMSRPGWRL